MAALISHYPRVSEWIFIGQTAINLAQVASIEFDGDSSGAHAIVRLACYSSGYEAEGLGKTWFKVRDGAVIRALRQYVEGLAAPQPIPEAEARRR